MPVKILLADKSITIQKVVEMLFSGRDYEVACVSDGESALNETTRVLPDVILADVDLPRMDGYAFAARLKMTPQLAQIPVILMMSRDDVFDSVKGKQAGIVDNIAKPFESQELISKVKKALTATPQRKLAEPPPAPAPKPAAASFPSASHAPATPREKAPDSILDIISEAPTSAEIGANVPVIEDSVFEVEPVVEEAEASIASEVAKALPVGDKAVAEMRAGLGLVDAGGEPQPEIVTFESLGMALEAGETAQFIAMPAEEPPLPAPAVAPAAPVPLSTPISVPQPSLSEQELRSIAEDAINRQAAEFFAKLPPPQPPSLSLSEVWNLAEQTVAKMAKDVFANIPTPHPPQADMNGLRDMVAQIVRETAGNVQPVLPIDAIRGIAEETISKITLDVVKDMTPPIPKISDETIRRGIENAVGGIVREQAREIIERVAWEVVPHLAELMIREEIERLKAGQ